MTCRTNTVSQSASVVSLTSLGSAVLELAASGRLWGTEALMLYSRCQSCLCGHDTYGGYIRLCAVQVMELSGLSTATLSVLCLCQVHAELMMDVPVDHGLLLENLLDLAHAPFTHTSTFAKGWPIPDVVRFNAQRVLGGHWEPYPIDMSFEPPCMVLSTIGALTHLKLLNCAANCASTGLFTC